MTQLREFGIASLRTFRVTLVRPWRLSLGEDSKIANAPMPAEGNPQSSAAHRSASTQSRKHFCISIYQFVVHLQ
ncbi:MAG: hypothetical protein PUP92_18550 [Rhizonema sp. PD38]|nr:hypothetical protein [Rhizonema sp. PD38]